MSKEPEKKIIAGLNHQSHLTESASVLEPEKKDVWGVKFDSHWEKIMPKDRVSAIVGSQVKNFIRQDFIPRAELVEKVKQIAMPKDAGWEDSQKTVRLNDLLDLLTQEK